MRDIIKKYKKNFLIVLFLGLSVYVYILLRKGATDTIAVLLKAQLKYIFVGFILLISFIMLEALVLYLFGRKKVKGLGYLDTVRMNASTQFFNAITPFAAGGQPFQVLYLNSRGLKTKDSTSIVLMNFITYNIAIILLGLICIIFKYGYFSGLMDSPYILLIGFGVNVFVTLITFVLAFSKKIYHLFIEVLWVRIARIKFLRRFKLEEKTEGFKQAISDFNREIKALNRHKFLWVETVTIHFFRLILFYSIPVFIFLSLGQPVSGNEINIFVGSVFIMMVMSYIPTPGASIGAELTFGIIYSIYYGENVIYASMIIWRFLTYYLYIILGFVALITLKYKQDLRLLNQPKNEEVDIVLQEKI